MKSLILFCLFISAPLFALSTQGADFTAVTKANDLSMCRGMDSYSNAKTSDMDKVSVEVENDLPFPLKLLWSDGADWRADKILPNDIKTVKVAKGSVLAIIDPSIGLCLGARAISVAKNDYLSASRGFDLFDGNVLLTSQDRVSSKSRSECPKFKMGLDIGRLNRGDIDPDLFVQCLESIPEGAALYVNDVSRIARANAVAVGNFERFVDAAGRCELMDKELEEELRRGLLKSRITVNLVVYQMNKLRDKGQAEIIKGKDEAFEVYVRTGTWIAKNYPELVKKFEPIPKKEGWAGPCMCGILGGC